MKDNLDKGKREIEHSNMLCLTNNNKDHMQQNGWKTQGAIHSTKIPTGPTGKRGPPQKVDQFFRNFSGWTEPIH